MKWASLLALLAVSLTTPLVQAAEQNLLYFNSSPGDYIGQGQTFLTTDVSTFGVGGNRDGLQVSTPWGYGMSFVPPAGQELRVANFTDAHRTPFRGASAGIEITGNGRGCNTITGAFDIREIVFNAEGTVTRLWMYYEQFCENTMPPLRGEIRFHALQAPEIVPQILRVPADFSTIQAAVNAVGLGNDTVLVAPGIYREFVLLNGRQMTIRAEGPAAQTIVEPPSNRAAFTISNAEAPTTRIEGFTIINCEIGVNVVGASPTISGNVISNCVFGVQALRSSAVIAGNSIMGSSTVGINLGQGFFPIVRNNTIDRCGAGIGLNGGEPTFHQNVIANSSGPGINVVGDSDPILTQNVIYGNAGIAVVWQTPAGRRGCKLAQNTIVGSSVPNTPAVRGGGYTSGSLLINNVIAGTPALDLSVSGAGAMPPVSYNLFFSPSGPPVTGSQPGLINIANNRVGDPRFLDPESGDFQLLATSPAIDAATTSEMIPADFFGTVRPVDGDGNGQAGPDMGAFEFIPGPPRAPRSLSAIARTDDIRLTWRTFDLAETYVLSRGLSAEGPFSQLAVVTGTEFIDADVVRDVTYYYVLAGRNASGTGANSLPVSARAGNFAPTAVEDLVDVLEDTAIDIFPLANDTDPNSDALSIVALLEPIPAGAVLGAGNKIIYTPPANFSGPVAPIRYRITDGRLAYSESQVRINVLPVNDAPVAAFISYQATANVANVVPVTITDPDSTEFEILIETPPLHGMIILRGGNSFDYLPTWGYSGADGATLRVSDGATTSATFEVNFNVRAPRDFDTDGMADTWENLWDLNNPVSDLDMDGVPNLNEYLSNTNPRDGNSSFNIRSIEKTIEGFFAIHWTGVGGVRYRIYSTDSLSAPLTPILRSAAAEIDPADYGVTTPRFFIDLRPAPSGQRFYRIQSVR